MLRGFMIACLLGVVSTSTSSCESKTCTLVGCITGASLTGQVTRTQAGVSIEICFNGLCGSTDCDPASGYCGWSSEAGLQGIIPDAQFDFESTDAGLWNLSGNIDVGSAHDGDHFVVKITDQATGDVLGIADTTAQYSPVYPNGPDCGAACKQANVKVAPP